MNISNVIDGIEQRNWSMFKNLLRGRYIKFGKKQTRKAVANDIRGSIE